MAFSLLSAGIFRGRQSLDTILAISVGAVAGTRSCAYVALASSPYAVVRMSHGSNSSRNVRSSASSVIVRVSAGGPRREAGVLAALNPRHRRHQHDITATSGQL